MVESRAMALTRGAGASEAIVINLRTESIEVLVVTRYIPLIAAQRTFELLLNVEDLVTEISELVQQALTSYNQRGIGPPIPNTVPAYISGRHQEIGAPLLDSLQNALDRPVRLPDPPISYPPDFPVIEYMANVGLALAES